tara:strand:+ start:417 stop:953 length:537 start_codon:yes stop_codon:yes gene_type:complete
MPNDPHDKLKLIPVEHEDIDKENPFDEMLYTLNNQTMQGLYDAYVALFKAEGELRHVREGLTAGRSYAAGGGDFARIGQVMTTAQEQVAQYSEYYRVELIACTLGGYQAPTLGVQWNYENWLKRGAQSYLSASKAHRGVPHGPGDPMYGRCFEYHPYELEDQKPVPSLSDQLPGELSR